MALEDMLHGVPMKLRQDFVKALMFDSDELRVATINLDSKKVVDVISQYYCLLEGCMSHHDGTEFRLVVKTAYHLSTAQHYSVASTVTGYGCLSDLIMYPMVSEGELPVILFGILSNDSATSDGALRDLKAKYPNGYMKYIKGFTGQVVFVGLAFDTATRRISCTIEQASAV